MGELAPVVAQAARDGDAVAIGLVDDVADELASFATAVDPAAGPARPRRCRSRSPAASPAAPRTCSCRASTTLVREVAPAAEVTVLHAPPVLGAALLGLDRLAPGDHAAADRLRARSSPGTPTLRPRPPVPDRIRSW